MLQVLPRVAEETVRVRRGEPLYPGDVVADDELRGGVRQVQHHLALTDLDGSRQIVDIAADHLVADAGRTCLELLADLVLEGRDLLAAGRGGAAGVAVVNRSVVDPVQRRNADQQDDEHDQGDDETTRDVVVLAAGVALPDLVVPQEPEAEQADHNGRDEGDEEREARHLEELPPREIVDPRVRVHADDVHETSVSSSKEL